MTTVSDLPGLVVLCADGQPLPPRLAPLSEHFSVRRAQADDLAEALPGAEVVLLWDFFNKALERAWPAADQVRWVHVAAAGVDAVLFDGLRSADVVLTNARGIFDQPIAEYVLAAIASEAKLLPGSAELQRAERWRHREPRSLAGAHAVVIGTGGIGRATARLLRAVGMRVTGVGRTARAEDPDFGTVVASDELARVVVDADHLVNAAPLTPQTTGLLDAAVFDALPTHAHVVNVGRGASLVEDDLVRALRSGSIAAASLDVFATEPLPQGSPLWTTPGVRVSAHMSGDVAGWRDRLLDQFVDQAGRWRRGEDLRNIVDTDRGYVPGG